LVEPFHLFIDGDVPSRLGDVASGASQRLRHDLALDALAGGPEGEVFGRRRGQLQIGGSDNGPCGDDDGRLDAILELPDGTRPGVGAQADESFLAEAAEPLSRDLLAEPPEKRAGKQEDVFRAVSERGDRDGDNAQPV
jgi:hypothetical protein